MPVEYIDSPTGYIGLGETVGLGTITPQRRKRVRKGDKGIFPMAPTGAESYEGGYRTQPYPYDTFGSGFIDPARASAAGFQQPYSSIPNVFERYAGLPGGARANPDFPFLDTVFPNIPQPDDVIEDNDDLDEELRRQTLDFDINMGELGYDPSAANYDPIMAGQHITQEVTAGANFHDSLNLLSGGLPVDSATTATLAFNTNQNLIAQKEQLETALANYGKPGSGPLGFRVSNLFTEKHIRSELDKTNAAIARHKDIALAYGSVGAAPTGSEVDKDSFARAIRSNEIQRMQAFQSDLPTTTTTTGTGAGKGHISEYLNLSTGAGTGTGAISRTPNIFGFRGALERASSEVTKVGDITLESIPDPGGATKSNLTSYASDIVGAIAQAQAAQAAAQAESRDRGTPFDPGPDSPTAPPIQQQIEDIGIDFGATDAPTGYTGVSGFTASAEQAIDADPTGAAGGWGITIGKDGGQVSFMGMKK